MPERRGVYFAFQGLFMAVLLLLFVRQYHAPHDWVPRFSFLLAYLALSLLFLRLAPSRTLAHWSVQAGLFLSDALLASLVVSWGEPRSDLYLLYLLVLLGTALSRNLPQSLLITLAASVLYVWTAWSPSRGLPRDPEFWLRLPFLGSAAALLAVLARDFRQVQEDSQRKYQDRLVQLERLAALGQVAGEVAHRIKGPLTTIHVNAEVLAQRHADSPKVLRELRQIQQEADRCKDILKALLDLGRIEQMDWAPMDLRACVNSAIRSIRPQLNRSGVRLESLGLDAPMPARGDSSMLYEAVLAVLQNAVEAVGPGGGEIRVRAERLAPRRWWSRRGLARECYALVVEDSGCGIAPEDLERVFQPFFSTKGSGHGLGLSAALRILQKHGGTLEAHSEGPGKGACLTLLLPREPAPPELS